MRRWGIRLAVVVGLVLLWQAALAVWAVPAYIVPTPGRVAWAVAGHWRVLAARAGFTVLCATLGLLISLAFATALALAFTASARLATASMPLVIVFRSAPVTAIAPLIMLATGRGMGTSVLVVTIVAFFPLYVNLLRGLASPDRSAVELMRVLGASRWQQLRLVRLPTAMPYLFTGLRIAAGSAILGALLSEWLTGSPGLGALILDSGDMREVELLWAAVILSVLIALLAFWATSAGERRVLAWRV